MNDEYFKKQLDLANKRIDELEKIVKLYQVLCPIRKTDRSFMCVKNPIKPKFLPTSFSAEERIWRKKKREKKVG